MPGVKAARRRRRENSDWVVVWVVVDCGGLVVVVVVVVVVMMELRRLEVGVGVVVGMMDALRAGLRCGGVRTGGRVSEEAERDG